ncbi:hypothetical protein RIF29_21561 [Crotalaria pallida]|uniref:Uncharacterized protein n=1 Tax=Crotalaria pallida TaxID=3830 RepID=A0AAN9I7B0_CROPI
MVMVGKWIDNPMPEWYFHVSNHSFQIQPYFLQGGRIMGAAAGEEHAEGLAAAEVDDGAGGGAPGRAAGDDALGC